MEEPGAVLPSGCQTTVLGEGGRAQLRPPPPPPAPHSSTGVEPPNAALGERHGALGVRRWGSRGSRRAASHEGSQSSRSPNSPCKGSQSSRSPIPLAQDPSQHQEGRFPVRRSPLPPRAPRGEHPRAEDLFHLQEPVPRAGTLCGSRRAAPHARALGAPSCLRCTPCPTTGTQGRPGGGDSRSSAAAHRSETRRPAARLRRVNSGGSAKSCSSIVNCSSNASSRSLSANRSSRGEHRAGSRSAVAARIFSPHPVLQRSIRDVPSFQVKPHQAAPISVALGRSRAVGLRWERRDPPWFLSSVLRLCAALPGRRSSRRCAEGGSAAPPRCNWGAEFVGLLVLRSLGSHGGTHKAVAVLSPSLRAPFGLWGGRVATKERRKPSERRWNVEVRRAYGGGIGGGCSFLSPPTPSLPLRDGQMEGGGGRRWAPMAAAPLC